ncbi:flagellin [Rhodosalinus sediminis]|uniref:flagellin N-terminal helical domain-containing protein n=1 Tax=Rhodosalinus sediminis TaxID=1940533 RepID=UPI0023551F79|nr:flagellin [Rhodosalinus sediminis]
MTIGNALFAELNIQSFRGLRGEISDLQGRIASGTQDPRASADPLRFVRLSAATEQQDTLGRYADNLRLAGDRLDHADTVLAEANQIAQRLGEIALRSATDSTGDDFRSALAAEVEQLRAALIDVANATDGGGESLFAGLSGVRAPFRESAEGHVAYHGDAAVQRLRTSETRSLQTGVSGAEAFLGVERADGQVGSVFDIVDDLAASIGAHPGARESAFAAEGGLRLSLDPDAGSGPTRLTVEGPDGRAEVAAGAPGALVAAINAATGQTGVTASVASGTSIDLTGAGTVSVSRIVQEGARGTGPAAEAVALDAGTPVGAPEALRPLRHDKQAQMDAVDTLQNHFADLRSKVGALGAAAESQGRTVENRQVMIREAVAGLEDLDVAAAITDLRTRLVTLQAAQQSFVKVSGLSLFDYLR